MNELKVGIFTVAALVIFGAMVLVIGDINLGSTTNVVVDFSDALGIKSGEKVYLSGLRTGQVVDIEYAPLERRVYLTLRIDGGSNWPEGSQFAIDTLGLMGEKYVGIEPLELRPMTVSPLESACLEGCTLEGKVSRKELLRSFVENEEIVIRCDGVLHYGILRRLFMDGSMILMMETLPEIQTGSSVSIGLSSQSPEIRAYLPYRTEPDLTEVLVELEGDSKAFTRGMELSISSSGQSGDRVMVTRPPRGAVEARTLAGLRIGERRITYLTVGFTRNQEIPQTGSSLTLNGISARVSGRVYLGTKLLGMGDLLKTGRDVLRRVHAGVETADRLLARLNRVMERSRLEERVDELSENLLLTSRDIRDSAGSFKGVVVRIGQAADKVGGAVDEASDVLKDFSRKAGGMVDRLGNAVDGVKGIVDDARPEISSTLKAFRSFSARMNKLAEEGGEDFKKMAFNLSRASERVDGLMKDIDYKGPVGKKVADLIDSLDSFSTDMGDVAHRVRELLGDRELGGEIRSTMKGIGSLSDSVRGVIGGITRTRYGLRVSYLGGDAGFDESGDMLLDIYPGGRKRRITLGAEGIGHRDSVRATWEAGSFRSGSATLGVIESRLGVGLHAKMGHLTTGIEALDPKDFRVNADLRLSLSPDFSFRLKWRDITSQQGDPSLHAGVETIF